MTAKEHHWTRHPTKAFLLRCGDCGQRWCPDQSKPKNACVPGPGKALAS